MTLHAGPFSLEYQNGFIRYLRYGEDEVLRMMYFALRDENWGTLESRIADEKISEDGRSFQIAYTRFNVINTKDYFRWNVIIKGSTNGEITFTLAGECFEAIKKNRAGFCVLHPIKETRNQPCIITHPDDTTTSSAFPDVIDPLNPFLEIKTMQWKSGKASYQLEFTGDVFETEDQRNWTDASFKTFCTPLHIPFPVQLQKGDIVQQQISFKPLGNLPTLPDATDDVVSIEFSVNDSKRLPDIGLCASTETNTISSVAIKALSDLGADHYRVEVHLHDQGWAEKFSNEAETGKALSLPLHVVVYVDHQFESELNEFSQHCNGKAIALKSLLVLNNGSLTTNQRVIDFLPRIKQQLAHASIGAGTAFNFTELNRNRFTPAGIDFITHSVQPQEHAFDDASLIENIAAQGDTVRSAKNIYPGKEIHISPVTLRKRFNPYSASPTDRVLSENAKADPRQTQPFNGPWALGSIKTLAMAGAQSADYFQTVGKQGLADYDGQPYPVYHAVKTLLSHKQDELIISTSNRPLIADAFVFKREDKWIAVVFNYTGKTRTISIRDRTLQIPPYEVVQIVL